MDTSHLITEVISSPDSFYKLGIDKLALEACGEQYPYMVEWLEKKFVKGLINGTRVAIVLRGSLSVIVGLALVKLGNNKNKLCHFHISKKYRMRGYGKAFIDYIKEVYGDKPMLITFDDKLNVGFSEFIIKQGFTHQGSVNNLYREDSIEQFYQLPIK